MTACRSIRRRLPLEVGGVLASAALIQPIGTPSEHHALRTLRLGIAARHRHHLSRGRAWFCRAPPWRPDSLAARSRQFQSAQAHRSVRNGRIAGHAAVAHSPFLFGYAKPVPVNFRALRNPRIGMVLVALAGPATNIALALVAAAAFHGLTYVPADTAQWVADNLKNALVINVVLAIFNMLPIPPLDGGRVAVGLLPKFLALPLARLEPYGMLILIALLILLPLAGSQFGLNLDVISTILRSSTGYVIQLLLLVTGNT